MSQRQPLADIQFISDFAAYARGRGDAEYDYTSNRNCACCQFVRETGRAVDPRAGGTYWRDELAFHPYPEGVALALVTEIAGTATFSALADRLEALLTDAPTVELGQ